VKIALYGATGMVGREIRAEATRRGHTVTGVTRSGSGDTLRADLADTATFSRLAAGNDAVVIAVAPDRTGGPHEPLLAAVDAVIASGPPARVLVVVGAGSLEVGGTRLVDQPAFPEAYKAEASTMARVLDKFRAAPASLDWTGLSPAPAIAPGLRTGVYHEALDTPAGSAISSQDFAVAVVDELEKPKHRRQRFTVAN
jgi:putative NADH-flavin reductase